MVAAALPAAPRAAACGHAAASSMQPLDKMPSDRFRPNIPGATYFITSITHHRHHWFGKPELAQVVVGQLKYYEGTYEF
jgi:hypothetical protein